MRYSTFLFCSVLAFSGFSIESPANLTVSFPEQRSTMDAQRAELVGGVIHPLSGFPCIHRTDLVARGAQEVAITRVFAAPFLPHFFHPKKDWDEYHRISHLSQHDRGWEYLPYATLKVVYGSTLQISLPDSNGAISLFTVSGPDYSNTTLAQPPYGVSNYSNGAVSGKYDLRNTQIVVEESGAKITVKTPCGTTRVYLFMDEYNPMQLSMHSKYEYQCRLVKEILPNGKILKYTYDDRKLLKKIESYDPKEKHVYASIAVEGSPSDGKVDFTSSSATKTTYTYSKETFQIKFKEKKSNSRQDIKAQYTSQFLKGVDSPNYQNESFDYSHSILLGGYFSDIDAFQCEYGDSSPGNPGHFKVNALSLPVGVNNTFLPVYKFQYDLPVAGKKEGKTTIYNSDGTYDIYNYSSELLLSSIQSFSSNNKIQKEQRFLWNQNHQLESLQILDGSQTILTQKSYQYDAFGNPTQETFTGDLTGDGTLQSIVTLREFSTDGKHLLLSEKIDDGREEYFTYIENTNLLATRRLEYSSEIFLREFLTYDDCNNLIRKTLDDGSSLEADDLSQVTQRMITEYVLRTETPFLHMPEWIVEKYLEQGQEKLLSKTHLTYDQYGNVAQEDHYDAKGTLAYTIHKSWNKRGDLLSESNPLGQTAYYSYDERGNCIRKTNFSGNKVEQHSYDVRSRLRDIIETGSDELCHTSTLFYDYRDHLIHKSDYLGNTISYTYDPITHLPTKTEYPAIATTNSKSADSLPVVVFADYDALGREIRKTDANGNTTHTKYNAYGSPTQIIHPDGKQEVFRYTKSGKLASHVDREGKAIQYDYDLFGRVLSKTYLDALQNKIAQEKYTFTVFNLIQETDKEGNLTKYAYDGAGRKILQEMQDHVTLYSYNSLGGLERIVEKNNENSLVTEYQRDLLERVLEEKKSDLSGIDLYKISYSYDADGNLYSITHYSSEKPAVESFLHDSFGRIITKIDPMGNTTHFTYNESYKNRLGQKALQVTTASMNAPLQVITYNPNNKIVKKKILGIQNSPIFSQELFYDPNGNLIEERDLVYENGSNTAVKTTTYCYNSINQIESITQGARSPFERKTSFAYTPIGKISTKTLPDGITLSYEYDACGNLEKLTSSDGQIDYQFQSNCLGHLLFAKDLNSDFSFERHIDSFGNVLLERFSNRAVVEKSFDLFNRPLSANLAGPNYSNLGKIFYTYDPLYLRSITRKSAQSYTYCHRYNQYALDGNLHTETSIGMLGAIVHVRDLNDQITALISPSFSEKYTYDVHGNITSSIHGDITYRFTYNELSQLVKETRKTETAKYGHDSVGNLTQMNGAKIITDYFGKPIAYQNIHLSYDQNGNLAEKQTPEQTTQYSYDPLGRLVQVRILESQGNKLINFSYDPLNRQISKTVSQTSSNGWKKILEESYLYDGLNEVGSFTPDGKLKTLRVLGIPLEDKIPEIVAVEIGEAIYAPFQDTKGNIRRLAEINYKTIAYNYDPTLLGEPWKYQGSSTITSPWSYKASRYDPDLNLVYLNGGYYDPSLGLVLNTCN